MQQRKLATIAIACLFVPTFCSQVVTDDKCHYDFERGCLKIVSYTFKREVIEEKREFTIYYKRQIDLKEDVIADCHWAKLGKFDCDPLNGFVCDQELRETFSIRIENLCINSGEFLFDVKLSGILRCKVQTDQYSTNQTISPIKNQLMKRHIEGSKDQEDGKTNDDAISIVLPVTCACLFVLATLIAIGIFKLKKRGKLPRWQYVLAASTIMPDACTVPD